MRLESHILTEGRSKAIGRLRAYTLIEENCLKSAKAFYFGNGSIYRGVAGAPPDKLMVVDPKVGAPRKSANISNHYTILLDNISSWRKYPKRSKSIICSTKRVGASSYGTPFAVFPYDNSKIGVCPKDDLWESFRSTIGSLQTFTWQLNKLLKHAASGEPNLSGLRSDDDIKSMRAMMDKADELLASGVSGEWGDGIFGVKEYKWMKNYNGNMYKMLNKQFNPVKNGFKLKVAGDSLPDKETEVWTDGKSVMINISQPGQFDALMKNLERIIT